MNEEQKIDEIEEIEEPITISNGEKFFNPPENGWFLFTVILAGILFFLWGIRSGMEFSLLAVIGPIYILSIIILFRTSYRESKIIENEGVHVFIFRRSGFSYQTLVDALLGSAIPILIVSFFITQGIPSSPELNQTLMLVAMLCYVFIVPIIPLLGSTKQLGILKTTLTAELDESETEVTSLYLNVNPLDGYWYKNRNNHELLESIKEVLKDMLDKRVNLDQSV